MCPRTVGGREKSLIPPRFVRLRASFRRRALPTEIHDVDISAKAHIVGQVPAWMVGIFVDDDVIGVPEPAIAESDVDRRDRPELSMKPEPARPASGKPDFPRAGNQRQLILHGIVAYVAASGTIVSAIAPSKKTARRNAGGTNGFYVRLTYAFTAAGARRQA